MNDQANSPATSPPEELLSLNRLSRKLDISYPKALQLLNEGELKPDFTSDHSYLYRASRLPEIEAGIQALKQG